jgi:tetratricopeptide (TPR) repeat protein
VVRASRARVDKAGPVTSYHAMNQDNLLSQIPVDALLSSAADYERQEKAEEARALYGAVLLSDAQNAGALRRAGALDLSAGRSESAAALLSRAVQADPDDVVSHANLAVALARLGMQAQALDSFDRALALRPGAAGILFNRAVLKEDMGRLTEALADLNQVLIFAPDFTKAALRRDELIEALARQRTGAGPDAPA